MAKEVVWTKIILETFLEESGIKKIKFFFKWECSQEVRQTTANR